MKPVISSHCRGISLIKGIDFDESGPLLITDIIKRELNIPMCALSGANIANEIAAGKFCETTIGYENEQDGELMKQLFHDDMFRVGLVKDVAGVQVCGALKNVIALGAGFCDALEMGNNTKSALMRIGLIEMQRFTKKYYSNVKLETFMESCGVADLITTCYGGRNRKCAEAFVRTKKSWEELEEELLGGQKLQGTTTAKDVYLTLKKDNVLEEFPHMVTIYRIAFEGLPPERIVLDI
jgi:glycerol-3-phosphate dehydrogenase (NAD+)